MNKFLNTLSVIVLFVIGSCEKKEINYGTYTDENEIKELIINEDKTFEINYTISGFILNETISYGNWRYEDGFLVMTSAEEIQRWSPDMEVEEVFKPENDSITVIINNPYEESHENMEAHSYSEKDLRPVLFTKSWKPISYQVGFIGEGGLSDYDNIIEDAGVMNLEFENKISLKLTDDYKIDAIFIKPYAHPLYYPGKLYHSYLEIDPYETKNPKSNYFVINIPDLTLGYMYYDRFNEEYVKIIDENTVKLEGVIYKRVSKPRNEN